MPQSQMTVDQALTLGLQLQQARRLKEAEAVYRRILALDPRHPDALHRLGVIASEVGRFDVAVKLITLAIASEPNTPHFYNDLGQAYLGSGHATEAANSYHKALAISEGYPDAHNGLGAAALNLGQLDVAIWEFNRAITLRPTFAEALNNLGTALQEKGKFANAIHSFRQAIEINSDYAMAHHNLGLMLLLSGDLESGWREYESRHRAPELGRVAQAFPQPRWDGSNLNGRRILVHVEQGFGDTLQFVRYIPKVVERGGKIILGCQRELGRLLEGFEGIEQLILHGQTLPEFDVHCPLLSLPAIFQTTLQSIPGGQRYIKVKPQLRSYWERRTSDERRLRVGLVWAGRPTQVNDRRRSISPEQLDVFQQLREKCCFYSLQKGIAAPDELVNTLQLIDWTNELGDFADTAALIDNLDVVVSIDSAVIHLAGAMMKPAFLLLSHVPAWRWLLEREDSPWYPSLRLFRQNDPGDWSGPLQRVSAELRKRATEQ